MGNIEIRQEDYHAKRVPIFSDRRSLTPHRRAFGKSLTPNNRQFYAYSPIKYSNQGRKNLQNTLTQRKANTSRLNSSRFQNNLTYPPYEDENTEDNFTKRSNLKSKVSKIQNLPQLSTQNYAQNSLNSFNLSGKIVSNSRRNNNDKLNSNEKYEVSTQSRQLNNPLQNREIIKKVRNFNDFLNQIKRKLKQDKQETFQRKKSSYQNFKRPNLQKSNFQGIEQNRFRQNDLTIQDFEGQKNIQNDKSSRRIQVALKLENQKLELQKYRNLVERELSKNHSIENISLCTKNSGQKVLTIQYEYIQPSYAASNQNSRQFLHKKLSPKNIISKINNTVIGRGDNKFKKVHVQNSKRQVDQSEERTRQMVKKLKEQYEQTMKNMLQLGKIIQKYQKQHQKNGQIHKSQAKILVCEQSQASCKQLEQKIDSFKLERKVQAKRSDMVGKKDDKIEQKRRDNLTDKEKPTNLKDSRKKIQKIQGLFQKLSLLQSQYQQTDRQVRQAIQSGHDGLKFQDSDSYFEVGSSQT